MIRLTWKSDLLVRNLRRRLPQPSHWKSQFVNVAFSKSHRRKFRLEKNQTGEKSVCCSCFLTITLEKNYTGEKSVSKSLSFTWARWDCQRLSRPSGRWSRGERAGRRQPAPGGRSCDDDKDGCVMIRMMMLKMMMMTISTRRTEEEAAAILAVKTHNPWAMLSEHTCYHH